MIKARGGGVLEGVVGGKAARARCGISGMRGSERLYVVERERRTSVGEVGGG